MTYDAGGHLSPRYLLADPRPSPKTFDELKAQEGTAPYDDGGRQPCGCPPEFHGARCGGAR